MVDFRLYGYQEEVVQRALLGENVIIWLPTGSGKTRAAVYVAKRHLETTPNAKVMVLVNRVHLVEQHYSNEFKPHLGGRYKLVAVTSDSEVKDFFGNVVQDSDLVVCTAQILHNAMTDKEEGKHVELSDITLLIIDECHHTKKDSVYNKVMGSYVEQKLKGEGPLPQILGLTASPGVGGAKILENAVNYVLQICANLDSAIVSTKNHVLELKEKVPIPIKTFDIVDKRPKDPFGDHLRKTMQQIHEYMSPPPYFRLRECGTQEYESDVVVLELRGVRENNRVLSQCALHLREYNDALLINDTLRMMDACRSLEEFYDTKFTSAIDTTDSFLKRTFQENRVELRKLAGDSRYENPKMSKLESVLLNQFGPNVQSRGILFCKTRKGTHYLNDWVSTNEALQEAGVVASAITGSGNGMTQNEQKHTIRNFRSGALNLLISTSVAEEGLDIPECNLVVRYGLLTNEIAQQQAIGRARMRDSQYSVVGQAAGQELRREITNENLEELTGKAVAVVQDMSLGAFRAKIALLQKESVQSRRAAEYLNRQERTRNSPGGTQLLCRNCSEPVASGHDIKVIDNTHYVNVNPDFKKRYKVGGQVDFGKKFDDWEPGRKVLCNNGQCNKQWGYEMNYKGVALLPNLAIKNFALETPNGRTSVKKWKGVPFPVDPFSFEKYCQDNFD
ncbi:ATP-dependent RNA helicase DHX58 [Brachionichthys hirsutus]|uniref:ATP-dependent RNA helicase DHX58 n=1 Tax=Brachionichthys hirsutus TaxID=412623 RepID=UPI0036054542